MNKINLKFAALFSTILFLLSNPIITLAKPIEPCGTIGGCLGGIDAYKSKGGLVGGRNAIVTFIIDIANILVYISAAVAVIMIIFGGYKMLISGGSEEQFKKGRQTLVYAVVGLLVAILAGTIVNLVGGISNFRL